MRPPLARAVFLAIREDLEALGRMELCDLRARHKEFIGTPAPYGISRMDLRLTLALFLQRRAAPRRGAPQQ